ncbi:DgyrCDS2344 [Dimorphilus gyrociliatus]|uniref:Phosphotransferase n=1 Tax=Dimorphilus gyrociliatus TaxID=2664684 RepID=A0A7I8VF45_9ANNE|nr:DgyrCDS2344 [Dimorphilus gyrociliatus]
MKPNSANVVADEMFPEGAGPYIDIEEPANSSALLMDLAANEKSVHSDFHNTDIRRVVPDAGVLNTLAEQVRPEVKEYLTRLNVAERQYDAISIELDDAMSRGLRKETHSNSSVKMYPTFVRQLPTRKENGTFLALDLGGTNFRVLGLTLKSADNTSEVKKPVSAEKQYELSAEMKTGEGEALFEYLSACLYDFVRSKDFVNIIDEPSKNRLRPLGFTFSFPCKQLSLGEACLTQWTKGFKCENVEGRDVGQLLNKYITRKSENIECCAVLNDTVGCTGTNACYLEKINNIETLPESERNLEPSVMIVNTEWGAYGSNRNEVCIRGIRTDIDKIVDTKSFNPNRQMLFEKMISGLYLGELVRYYLIEGIDKKIFFPSHDTTLTRTKLSKPYSFLTKHISKVEAGHDPKYANQVDDTLKRIIGLQGEITNDDRLTLRYLCHLASKRAAYLAGTALSVLLKRVSNGGDEIITIGIDGTLHYKHPAFDYYMRQQIRRMYGNKFELQRSEDGSGLGAAIVAATSYLNKRLTITSE